MARFKIICYRMVLKICFIFLAAFTFYSCDSSSKNEKVEEEVDLNVPMNTEDARAIYLLNCASCHGGDGTLKSAGAADLSKSKMIESQIEKVILNGNEKGMMPYKDILTKREVKGLVKFVPTFRK